MAPRPSPRPRPAPTPAARPSPRAATVPRPRPSPRPAEKEPFLPPLPAGTGTPIRSEPPQPPGFQRPADWPTVMRPRLYRRGGFWTLAIVVAAAVGIVLLLRHVSQEQAPVKHTVVYRVTGNAPADVSYYSGNGTGTGPASTQLQAQRLPWSRSIVVQGSFNGFSVTATFHDLDHQGSLACTISVDGKLITSDHADGKAFVGCDGTGYRGS